jgi:hydroxymethylpyrimidine pyrophosphatase-like HAD family hydrolase
VYRYTAANMLEVLPRGNGKARGVEMLLAHLSVDAARVVGGGEGLSAQAIYT